MNLKELEDSILSEEDVEQMFKNQLECVKKSSECYKLLENVDKSEAKIIIKADLSQYEELKDICKKRIQFLQDKNAHFNKRFRMVAQDKLNPLMYKTICEAVEQKQVVR